MMKSWLQEQRETERDTVYADLGDIPKKYRAAMLRAIAAGDKTELNAILHVCLRDNPVCLDYKAVAALREACDTANRAITAADDRDRPETLEHPTDAARPLAFHRLNATPGEWIAGIAAAIVTFLWIYLALRGAGAPPPPGMP
jgi:hypothetical protein